MELKKHGNNLIQKNDGEERQEEYPTPVPYTKWDKSRVHFLSLFSVIFL